MTSDFDNYFRNFKKLLEEEEGKENEDFKNVWEAPEDENSFYKKINEIASRELDPAIDDIAITLEVQFDYNLFLRDESSCNFENQSLDNKEGNYTMLGIPYEPLTLLAETGFGSEPLYVCPLTGRDHYLKPSFSEHLKDIDHFIADAHFKIKSLYNCSFLYKDENEYSCIPFSDLLQLEKEYSKRWNKIKKIKDRQNEVRLQIKGRCWIIRKLLKKYKYYIHLKYLRELFVKNKGNSITYRAI